MSESIRIFDTTLRDGEQAAGASMSAADRLKIACMLDASGVDIIEAGFPIANQGIHDSVYEIAGATKRARICALARGSRQDVDAAASALVPAGDRARIHVFVATDAMHMAVKLSMTPEMVLERIRDTVSYARRFVSDVQYSSEVATTTEPAFLFETIRTAIEAGATTINIPDTTGYMLPHEYGELIARVAELVSGFPEVIVSVHTHNDRGLATANALEGIRAGARQVECTINGLGERAGNASLEEVVMALTLRPEVFGLGHNIDTAELMAISKVVEAASGIVVAPNKAFVGANAFAHESGIHQAGVSKDPMLYEVCDPALVGNVRRLPIGKLSGKAGLQSALSVLGYPIFAADVLGRIYDTIMQVADRTASLSEAELHEAVASVS